jgi:hypothetical protein
LSKNSLISKTPINLSGLLTVNEFPNFNLLTFFIYNIIFFGFGKAFSLPRRKSGNNENTLFASSGSCYQSDRSLVPGKQDIMTAKAINGVLKK